MSLSIVTVTHNSARHIPDYVESFLISGSGREGAEIEFVIVENSGHPEIDGAFDPLRRAGFRVRLIEVPNRGFGHACNAGAAVAAGATLVFVNPDLQFIDPIDPIDRADRPVWGTVTQIGDGSQEHAFDVFEEEKSLLGSLRTAYRGVTPNDVRWRDRIFPSGAFFIIDRALFLAAGGFDERFFMYYEEAELSRRVQGLAGPPLYFRDIRVTHKAFGSAANLSSMITHETRGLLTYAAVTGKPKVLVNRYIVLMIGSLISGTARLRLKTLMREHRATGGKQDQ